MNSRNILVVDDDSTIAEIVCLRLRRLGLEAVSAGDTVQADLRIAKLKPDLIILDVAMPGGSGFDYYSRLAQNPGTADIPVIFMTSYRRRLIEKNVPDSPRVRFHVKPLNFELLQSQIKELLPPPAAASQD